MNPQVILDFWFNELTPTDHFTKNEELDKRITTEFKDIHKSIDAGETDAWRQNIHGRLAEIIVLDQFSRNMFRGTPESFAYDSLALILAQEALKQPNLNDLSIEEKAFLYMPFMHSESYLIHERAVLLFSEPGLENNLDFEHRHFDIIKQFGRYPHRNEVLGRASTPEEIDFLKQPNSSF
ncbi:DUF924 domain-containing protein [Vagococcus sp. DIV0080]|uniref:DUF924 domain-containing protein n=1 Tax=Candidatus Vagococcus giribetii TaxID=2230876 RepID=A0ABS3HSH1_9ENTE|nr:DUF924 family protein [Vagococcus sp. DIV0080]MBO0476710.1 DUF924 domain-containing protein [Vagococcus sp. DIV0080]